jgi:hypothetical protein
MFGLILGELAALTGIMGIVVEMIDEWTLFMSGYRINRVLVALVIIAALYFLAGHGLFRSSGTD